LAEWPAGANDLALVKVDNMARQSNSIASLKRLIKETPTLDELNELLEHLQDETHDRAAALTGGAILEGALKEALSSHLNPELKLQPDYLFQHTAPLGTFSAKIRMGYATGIYERTVADDLDCLREVRNAFAHTIRHIEFDTPEVATVCSRIQIIDRTMESFPQSDWVPSARSRYLISASFYTLALYRFSLGERDQWTAMLIPARLEAKRKAGNSGAPAPASSR
jgi:DNA-binding MltR family transcriptional regulator